MMASNSQKDRDIEPRVARVETELESVVRDIGELTNDVRALAAAVRQQGENAEAQFRQLHIAVTSAAGPRKTDWSLMVSSVGLVLAIGTAAMSPLYLRIGDLQSVVSQQAAEMREHVKLELHPVGKSRIDAIEKRVIELIASNSDDVGVLRDAMKAEIESVDKRFTVVEAEGSPITRERLSVIEERLKTIEKGKSE